MKNTLPGIIIFIAGFVTMAFEIAGSRVLGPYFGSSVFVWTSLIGIIMGALSVGYWLGGFLSVKRCNYSLLLLIIVAAALFILITATAHIYVLDRIVKYIPGMRLQTVFSALVLFAPASIGLGMILPYVVKLRVQDISSSGITIGKLYALSTAGSILGTFAAGFLLIPAFGFSNVLYAMPAVLLLLGFATLAVRFSFWPVVATGIVSILTLILWLRDVNRTYDYIDVDTQYNRVIIYDTRDATTGRPVKMLRVNHENSSAMYLDKDEGLVFKVLRYYRLMEHFVPNFESALMIGGSGYAFPKDYLKRYPDARLDVVEIDPGLTALARKYFNLSSHPNLRIFHEDGRTFLNRNREEYDAILMDAYKSLITVPYQLTTVEAVQRIYDALSPEGAVLANIISTLDPSSNQFLRAELATYRAVFPEVMLFAVQYPNPTEEEKMIFQNFMLIGLKSDKNFPLVSSDGELNAFLEGYYVLETDGETLILTDEYAPVEFFATKALR